MKKRSSSRSSVGGCGAAALTALAVLASLPAPGARAAAVVDPANDFLSTYTAGPQNGDLDVLNTNVIFNGANFTLSATLNGAIGTTPGSIYVFGLNRGTNNAPFGAFAPGVLFDAVVIARPDTTATVTNIGGATFQLAAGAVSINGSSLSLTVPLADLPTQGFAASSYQYNLWPRDGAGNNNQISDFAPDNRVVGVSVVPEPRTTTLLLLVGAAFPWLAWRRRRTAVRP